MKKNISQIENSRILADFKPINELTRTDLSQIQLKYSIFLSKFFKFLKLRTTGADKRRACGTVEGA